MLRAHLSHPFLPNAAWGEGGPGSGRSLHVRGPRGHEPAGAQVVTPVKVKERGREWTWAARRTRRTSREASRWRQRPRGCARGHLPALAEEPRLAGSGTDISVGVSSLTWREWGGRCWGKGPGRGVQGTGRAVGT